MCGTSTLFLSVFWLLLVLNVSGFSEIVPASRLTTWEGNVGVPGGIPNRTTIYTTLNPGATAAQIEAAVNNCPSGQVVYLNAGTYNLGSERIRIYTKNDWTLRGAGMGQTILTGNGGNIFAIGRVPWLAEWPAAHNITSGAMKGSTSVTLTDGTSGINNGELMVIEQPNTGDVFAYGAGASGTPTAYTTDRMNNNTAVVNIRVMVTSINGNTVTFTPPLPFTFDGSPRAIGYGGITGSKNFGIEDMTIKGSTGSGATSIVMMGCYAAWLKNVELTNFTKRGITPVWSANLEFRGCYIHEGAGGHDNGYALEFGAVNNCLIEDNIWYKCQGSLFLQGGCMANVIAYNAVFHMWNQDSGTQWLAGGFVANHSPCPMFNLFEGNYVSAIQPDFYYGPSRYGTLLRNYLPGTDVATTEHRQTVSIDSRQWDYNVIGNILGASATPISISLAKPNVTLNFAYAGTINWAHGATSTDQYAYSENRIFRLGYPNIGNNSYSGTGDPPTTTQLLALDLSVKPGKSHETIIHGNWDAANQAVTWHNGITDTTIPNSYFRSSKPSWFGNLAWPPYSPLSPPTSIADALASIPAGYRLLNGNNPAATPPTASATPTPTATPTPASSQAGLVAAYNFNEGSGAFAADASGNGNIGTINGATWTTQSRNGAALRFNGAGNVVVISNSASLNLSSAMTLEAWIYPTTSQSNWHAILHKETDAYYLHVSGPDGAMEPGGGAIFDDGEKWVSSPNAVPLNTWTHVAATYDGATLKVYINGTQVASRSVSGSIQITSNPLRIGGNTYSDQFFQGVIDEVRVYNRALTQGELQADMSGAPQAPANLKVVSP